MLENKLYELWSKQNMLSNIQSFRESYSSSWVCECIEMYIRKIIFIKLTKNKNAPFIFVINILKENIYTCHSI